MLLTQHDFPSRNFVAVAHHHLSCCMLTRICIQWRCFKERQCQRGRTRMSVPLIHLAASQDHAAIRSGLVQPVITDSRTSIWHIPALRHTSGRTVLADDQPNMFRSLFFFVCDRSHIVSCQAHAWLRSSVVSNFCSLAKLCCPTCTALAYPSCTAPGLPYSY